MTNTNNDNISQKVLDQLLFVAGRVENISGVLKTMREDQKQEQTLARQNTDRLGRIESGHDHHDIRITENFKQHEKDFYPAIKALDLRLSKLEVHFENQSKEDDRFDKRIDELQITLERKIHEDSELLRQKIDDTIKPVKTLSENNETTITALKTTQDKWTGGLIITAKILGGSSLLSLLGYLIKEAIEHGS